MPELYRDESGTRTEPPTPLRVTEARRKGQVACSSDLTSGLVLLGTVAVLGVLGARLLTALTGMTAGLLDGGEAPVTQPGEVSGLLWDNLVPVLTVAAPLCLMAVLIAVVGNVLQVGFLLTGETIRPKFGRLSPEAGFRRIASRRSLVRMGLVVAKVSIVTLVCVSAVRAGWSSILGAAGADAAGMAAMGGGIAIRLALHVGVALLVLGVVDYLYQRWEHRQDLKITPRELREDLKRMEGDAFLRRRRRRMASQLLPQPLTVEVPRASVTIVAPGGPVVALRYDRTMRSPRLVAKGSGRVGERIRRIAEKEGVPVVEDAVLSAVLNRRCKVGGEIPRRFYELIAEILIRIRGGRSRAARECRNT